MRFEHVLPALAAGHRVRRAAWPKDMTWRIDRTMGDTRPNLMIETQGMARGQPDVPLQALLAEDWELPDGQQAARA